MCEDVINDEQIKWKLYTWNKMGLSWKHLTKFQALGPFLALHDPVKRGWEFYSTLIISFYSSQGR